MSGGEFYGTPEKVRRLLRATGAERDALLRELFGSAPPGQQDQAMYQLANGLIVPESAVTTADPLDRMRVYLTTEEILGPGRTISLAAIIEGVKTVSLESTISWCAAWVAKLFHPGKTHREVDAEFLDSYIHGPYRTKIENLLRDPHAVLLAPQTLIVIAKIALEFCEPVGEPPANEDVQPLITAALALPTHLTAEVEDLVDDDLVIDVNAGPMGVYLVANQLFNNAPNWQTAWAVYQRCLRELPRELADHPRVVDFEAAYFDATGVPLEDLVTVCAVVWAQTISGNPTLMFSYFDALKWDSDRLDAVLDLISATPERLRELLRADADSLGVLWSTKTFDQLPLVRWRDRHTVLHPAWVVNRSTGLWPLLDVRRDLGDRKRVSRVAASVEHTHEHFALEAVEDLVGAQRMYRDDALRRAYGKGGKVADAAVDYGSSWVVVEVTTEGFQLKTVAGVSEQTLAEDVDDIVRKATQVEATIDNIRRNERALTGHAAAPGPRKFYPVVVVASKFAGNPVTFTMLSARLKAAGVLQADDCAPVEVLTLDDLLAMEGASEKYGFGFLDLLAEKASVEGPLVPMIEFLAHKLGHNAPLPARVERSWKEWMGTAIERLREAGDAPGAEGDSDSPAAE